MYPVAFDIETTGFLVDDEATVVGLQVPMGSLLMMQSGGRPVDADNLTRELEDRTEKIARVRVYDDEHALLEAASKEVRDRISNQDGAYLTGYNAEVYYGNSFDFPFLRTAYAKYDLNWPFDSAYVDVYPAVKKFVNTNVDEDTECNDLVGAYDALIDDGDGDYDPFDDSSEAVNAWEDEEWVDLLAHCQSDIRRTQALAEFAESYIPKRDRRMKNLSPW